MECDSLVRSEEPKTMEEHLDQCCVYYMSIGVPYDEFWDGDPCAFKYYVDSYIQKRKIENENMWIQGMYNFVAHQTTLANAFGNKGEKPHEYIEKPMDFFGQTEAEEKLEAEKVKQKVIDNLTAFQKEWERNVR